MRKYLIVGGTGTLGKTLIKIIKQYRPKDHISIYSRDELKQQELKKEYPDLGCVIGDIRDYERLYRASIGYETVFHVAALKHIDVAERNAEEAVKTNVLGTINVANACLENSVPYCVFSSTDKAVLPVNIYGHTKAIGERYLLSLNAEQDMTRFKVYRWGNILGSRGSAINYFVNSLKNTGVVHLTHEQMTRFWIRIETAAAFMLDSYRSAPDDQVSIPYMKAAPVTSVIDIIARILDVPNYKTEIIGIRNGEKIHECLNSTHESCLRSDNCEQYTPGELYDLLEPIVMNGCVE